MSTPVVRKVLAILAIVMVATPALVVPGAAYEVRLSEQRAGESIAGTVRDDGRTWSFKVTERGGREIEFRQNGRSVARLAADSSGATADVRVGQARWNTRYDAPPVSARAETSMRTASAIREAAIKLAELAPGPEYKNMRLTALELYAETARVMPESRARGALGHPLAMPRTEPARNEAVCESYTQDALLDCRDDEGNDLPVVPFLDDSLMGTDRRQRHHDPNECYGACGSSCGGKCIEIPVACASPESRETPGDLCYAPHPQDDTLYKPSDDFDTSLAKCPSGTTSAGLVTVCTSASCCFQHDECNRHDLDISLGAYLKCQMWGLRECGFSAVYGVPKVPWTLKWFRASHEGTPIVVQPPLEAAGLCGNGAWTAPDVIPHEKEQAVCPIHGVKHGANDDPDETAHGSLGRWLRDLF
jgi:hypothetical protein